MPNTFIGPVSSCSGAVNVLLDLDLQNVETREVQEKLLDALHLTHQQLIPRELGK